MIETWRLTSPCRGGHAHGGENHLPSCAHVVIAWLLSVCVVVTPSFAGSSRLSGVVVDGDGFPVPDAVVRLQGSSFSTFTDREGRFEIDAIGGVSAPHLTAWKAGFYNGGQPVSTGDAEYRIRLVPIPPGDNLAYDWLSPLDDPNGPRAADDTTPEPCRKCHPGIALEWSASSHASSAVNPLFIAFFGGTDSAGTAGVAPGYKLDFPRSDGSCSSCHVPALAAEKPLGSDPRDASGVARHGVFCDLCHKIEDVATDPFGGQPGILSIRFRRPADGHQLFYGPYDDVFPGDDSYHPLYEESRYCSPCHDGTFWGIPAYSEFREWLASDYPAKKISCQGCHMKSDGMSNRFAEESAGGRVRDPGTIPSHRFTGIGDRSFMANAIDLTVGGTLEGSTLTAAITVRNRGAGHAYPTGNPMRNMILLVAASDDGNEELPLIRGERVPVWGGVGSVAEGNYAGLPGKGFARVLRDVMAYPDGRPRDFRPEYPAPHWRPTVLESDTRIPADGSDISTYEFLTSPASRGSIRVTASLIYRRAYKSWLDRKGIRLEDLEIARKSFTLGGTNDATPEITNLEGTGDRSHLRTGTLRGPR